MISHRFTLLAGAWTLCCACSQQPAPKSQTAANTRPEDTSVTTVTTQAEPSPPLLSQVTTQDSTLSAPDTSPPTSGTNENSSSRNPELGAPNSAADNTATNLRDRHHAAPIPSDQANDKADLRITQQIRKNVMGDSTLSFTAKNVKIICAGGKVTLRGPVKTQQERAAIAAAAQRVAGVSEVDNQLEVK